MYCQFYGFKKKPFSATSEPHFFFESASHREAYAAIEYGITQRKGIILISGEVGTGKTTLCKKLLDRLDKSVKVSLVLNPYFSDMQLLQAIVEDFGIPIHPCGADLSFKILTQPCILPETLDMVPTFKTLPVDSHISILPCCLLALMNLDGL